MVRLRDSISRVTNIYLRKNELSRFLSAQRQITCDCALCDECAKNHGLIDFCPYHEKIVKHEKIDTPDYVVKSRVETWRRENE